MNSTIQNNNIPQLRFPEFDGEWIEKRLGSVFEMKAGNFVPAKEIENEPNVDLHPCYGGNGLRGYTKSHTHDGRYNLIGRQGALCGNVNLVEGTFHATEHAVVVNNNKNYNIDFVFYILNNLKLNRLATGQAQPGLSILILNSVKFFTTLLPEQIRIANFLTAVDKRINLLQKKKAELEQYKKGVMQKLFLVKTDGRPSLRFKQDDGSDFPDWEEKKLGKIGHVINGLTYSPNDIHEDGVLVLRSSNVKNRALAFEDNVSVNSDTFNPVKENDILICVRNGSKRLIGKNAIIPKKYDGLAFGAFMAVYRSNYNSFLFHWFDTDKYKKEVHKNLGATINSINGSDLRKFKVPFPCLKEQQKIASFLSSIDKSIEKLGNQIDDSVVFKQGLLQKMFV